MENKPAVRKCKRGHEITPDNSTKRGYCLTCAREQYGWKGNPPNAEKTHCPRGHRLEGDNLMISMRNGRPRRICKECHRERRRRYYRMVEKPVKHPRSKPGPKRKYY